MRYHFKIIMVLLTISLVIGCNNNKFGNVTKKTEDNTILQDDNIDVIESSENQAQSSDNSSLAEDTQSQLIVGSDEEDTINIGNNADETGEKDGEDGAEDDEGIRAGEEKEGHERAFIPPETPTLVKDINTTPKGSEPRVLATIGNRVFFVATTLEEGTELWITDGKGDGTRLVADINQGPQSIKVGRSFVFKNELYFDIIYGDDSTELLKTDGNSVTSMKVSEPTLNNGWNLGERHIAQDYVLFSYTNNNTNYLFKTDGRNVQRVHESLKYPRSFVAIGSAVYFSGETQDKGSELWKYTEENGAEIVKDLSSGDYSSSPSNLFTFKNKLYFTANGNNPADNNNRSGYELWAFNPEYNDVSLVKDITPGWRNSFDSSPKNFTTFNDEIIFVADDGNGSELWHSDGTEAGTSILCDINLNGGSNPGNLVVIGDKLIFSADDGIDESKFFVMHPFGQCNLLRGANNDLDPQWIYNIIPFSNGAFFTAYSSIHGRELWFYNRDDISLTEIKDINPGSKDGVYLSNYSSNYIIDDNQLFFSATDGESGYELWVSDGTQQNTNRLKDINSGAKGSNPGNFIVVGNKILFVANDDLEGKELWQSDGTENGTIRVTDLADRTESSWIENVVSFGNWVYFTYEDTLWRTDGREQGTELIHDFAPDFDNSWISLIRSNNYLFIIIEQPEFDELDNHFYNYYLWNVIDDKDEPLKALHPWGDDALNFYYVEFLYEGENEFFFAVNEESLGSELWKLDKLNMRMDIIMDINQGQEGSYPSNMLKFNGKYYFIADDNNDFTYDLFRTDGTTINTQKVIAPDDFSSLSRIVEFNDFLYIISNNGKEIWYMNSEEEFRKFETPILDGDRWQEKKIGDLIPSGSNLFITVGNYTHVATEIWVTDGSDGGTIKVAENLIIDKNSYIVHDGILYFRGDDPETRDINQLELWESDGTIEGTKIMANINPSRGSNPYHFVDSINEFYFTANDGRHGRELWRSDGTEAGTSMVVDLYTGSDKDITGSRPLLVSDGKLFIGGNSLEYGYELFVMAAK